MHVYYIKFIIKIIWSATLSHFNKHKNSILYVLHFYAFIILYVNYTTEYNNDNIS